VIKIVKIIAVIIIALFDLNGLTSSLFKKPNSLSKINGKPVFNEPVKHVKASMPKLIN